MNRNLDMVCIATGKDTIVAQWLSLSKKGLVLIPGPGAFLHGLSLDALGSFHNPKACTISGLVALNSP